MASKWKEVYDEVYRVMPNDDDDFFRQINYLTNEEETMSSYPPMLTQLKRLLKSGRNECFKRMVKEIIVKTKQRENDEVYRQNVSHLHSEMQPYTNEPESLKLKSFGKTLKVISRKSRGTLMGLAKSWSDLLHSSKKSIVRTATRGTLSAGNSSVVSYAGPASGAVNSVSLACVFLAYDAVRCIRQWWKGEISGSRCAKNILDSLDAMAGGVGGGFGRGVIGRLLYDAIIAGIGGDIDGSEIREPPLLDKMTTSVFDLPKTVALENAYDHLGVSPRASNSEVNTAFKGLCLKTHPDKGGSAEAFYKVQCSMAIIKADRGEL